MGTHFKMRVEEGWGIGEARGSMQHVVKVIRTRQFNLIVDP